MSDALNIATSLPQFDREGFAAFMLRMRAAGINSKLLFEAIEATPRRAFVEPNYHNAVWGSRMIPLDCGEVLERLDHQALVLHQLDIDPKHRVLEIGTGSGYTAAVMARMAGRVYTAERYKRLHLAANSRFSKLKLDNVVAVLADASNGISGGPFDRIVSWGSFEAVPRAFIEQLTSGGQMICPIGEADEPSVLIRLTKVGSRFEREDIGTVRVQPLKTGMPQIL